MAVMKQIDTCLSRFFAGDRPLKMKWFACQRPNTNEPILYLFHYHHLVLVYDFKHSIVLYEWWEREADKRGLDSAKEWLAMHIEWTQQKNLIKNP